MLVLASASPHRAKILRDAGLAFEIDPPRLDERAAEAPLREADVLPEDLAAILAEAKAVEVSERRSELVLGGDQVLALDGEPLHKVRTWKARAAVSWPSKAARTSSIPPSCWRATAKSCGGTSPRPR